MSKYLDFIGQEISQHKIGLTDHKQGLITIGSFIGLTMLAKNLLEKNSKKDEDTDPWAQGDDYAFIGFTDSDDTDVLDEQKTQPYRFMRPRYSQSMSDQKTEKMRTMDTHEFDNDSEAEEQFSFLDEATEQFNPFEDEEYSYDTDLIDPQNQRTSSPQSQADFFADFQYEDDTFPYLQYQDTLELPPRQQKQKNIF